MELTEFWAKTEPFQSVKTHGIVSGCVCRYLMRHYLSEGSRSLAAKLLGMTETELLDFMAYLTSLHDIGKIEYHFQCRDLEMKTKLKELGVDRHYLGTESFRHERTGEKVIGRIWKRQAQDEDSADVFAALIGAHHQKNHGVGSGSKDSFFAAHYEKLESIMGSRFLSGSGGALPEIPDKLEGVFESLLLGMLILSDWIASGSGFADAEDWIDQEDSENQIIRKTEAFLDKSGLKKLPVNWEQDFTDVWPWIPREGMRSLQQGAEKLMTSGKRHRLILMEAPMGEGKTEAGMYCAVQMLRQWKKDGFYVALPTAATSNQMVSRMEDWFQTMDIQKKVRLLHGMAWMVDECTSEDTANSEDHDEISRWLAPLRRGLLGQFSVGTIDQAMLAVTKAKYGVLRLLGLSNKVLVIDEIHSYDVYMGEFILRLLEWCRAMEVPVVMLSATLPPKLKAKLLAPYTKQPLSGGYPLITAVCEDGMVEEVPIEKTVKNMTVSVELLPILNDPEQIARKAAELTDQGGCVCVLMNTVRQAQKVYSVLESCFDGDLMLFHGQFPAEQRKKIEIDCIAKFGKDKSGRPPRAILVATQVVEQSLDVDFDAMLTAVAPIDLVLQRMGRIFRHEDTVRPAHLQSPSQFILIPEGNDFGVDGYVYPEVLLQQTIQVLKDRDAVRIPEDLAPLVADGYAERKVPPEAFAKWLEHMVGEQVEAGQSRKYLIGNPNMTYSALGASNHFFDDEGENKYLTVQTRLGEPSVRIALLEPELYRQVEACADKDGTAKVRDKELARQVQMQSVSVTERRLMFDKSELSYIKGDNLLAGVRVYPAQNGICKLRGGRIRFDGKLGVIIEEDKA
ncbi:MAG: CRISPR-associated helicase Cas3' [Oscillospiraceae bacterium]|nr:CRISPR-associated helicase Cas3' [Oscillospiraceae bacterium]